ncbi:two-component system, chemotaxis family, response regulator CheY [Lachnospiraceae bacterium KH1T2]|nr:two-component system, chemotaxis family, response regulator CheY [Lachnospiraceae bacterium KH1T2]
MTKNVLVVDDSNFMRTIITDILNANGYHLAGLAKDGQDVLRMYRELKPDLVIMDLTMQNVGGIDGLKMLKAEFPEAKVVVCSALEQREYFVKAIECGADDFITKPITPDKILTAVENSIGI